MVSNEEIESTSKVIEIGWLEINTKTNDLRDGLLDLMDQ